LDATCRKHDVLGSADLTPIQISEGFGERNTGIIAKDKASRFTPIAASNVNNIEHAQGSLAKAKD
jgi:hypothetical protein